MTAESLRLDKWFWQARFFKSRAIASKVCEGGGVRLNHHPVAKAHQLVRVGDQLTFPQGNRIQVIEVLALGVRRGPASEAQMLYRVIPVESTFTSNDDSVMQ